MNLEKMELGKKMDKALHYVAKNLRESGNNPKPVLFHSFKVANRLYEYNYSENIVIAAILHDLIEDTAISYSDIKVDFGKKIADIVQAVSFNPEVEVKLEQARLIFENCLSYDGNEALFVKCSDLIDNIDFVQFIGENKRIASLEKYELFLELANERIGDTDIFNELSRKVKTWENYM